MRHFGPPHTTRPHSEHGAAISRSSATRCSDSKAKGKTRIDVVDDYAYPVPVAVICKILGVPLKDEAHISRLDP